MTHVCSYAFFTLTEGFLGLLSILSLALCQSDGDPSLIITPVVNGEFLKFDHRIRWPAGRSLSKSVKQIQGENHFENHCSSLALRFVMSVESALFAQVPGRGLRFQLGAHRPQEAG